MGVNPLDCELSTFPIASGRSYPDEISKVNFSAKTKNADSAVKDKMDGSAGAGVNRVSTY